MNVLSRSRRRPIAHAVVAGAVVALALMLALVAGGAKPARAAAACTSPTTMTYASPPLATLAPFAAASQRGFFHQVCVTHKWEVSQSPVASLAEVVSGQVQVTGVGATSLYNALQQNLPLRVLAAGYFNNPGNTTLAVGNSSKFHTYKDLTGATIATPVLGGINQAAVAAKLAAAGVDVNSIKWTVLPFASIGDAVEAGRVDAGILIEPFIALTKGKVRTLDVNPLSVFGAHPALGFVVVSDKFYRGNKALVLRYQSALLRGNRYLAAHPDFARATWAKAAQFPADLAAKVSLPSFSDDLGYPSLMTQIRLCLKFGYIKPGISAAQLKAAFVFPPAPKAKAPARSHSTTKSKH